ncbi:MAG: alpha/beta fold hydrolase [Ectothiorhodospiraceae bacterium]|nr:alpha/beta fold hydrolase [Chromatiales bacterium]MCP5153972.1 alpha/beta fold hydrolase [Ectothiorhodospiraceae bacterium]
MLGDGAPLLVLHGLFGSGTNWRTIARRLAERHRVVLVDLRNHGASPHAPEMDYPLMAADVRALLDHLGLQRAALLGHSMGGKTAMRLALETPDRVERLCVVDIAPAPSNQDHQPVLAVLQALDLATIRRRADADVALSGSLPDPALRAFLLQNLVLATDGARWRIDLEAIAGNHAALTGFPDPPAGATYRGPTLFVRGARSDYLQPAHEPAIRALFPRAEMRAVAGAGHWVHAEQPVAFLETVLPFLDPEHRAALDAPR